MSCIFYKFKNNRDYDSVTFDGLYISLLDLKKMIMQVKKLKPTEVDLQIENAQTKTAYKSNSEMIPKNTSVIVSRIPVAKAQPRDTRAQWDRYKQEQKELEAQREADNQERLNQTADLVNAKATEADKIKAMIQQSTRDFNPDNYVKSTKYPTGPVPSTYICFKCQQPGHFIQNCPNRPVDSGITEVRMKRPTGIPNCFLSPATAGDPGALLTHSGHFAVPTIDAAAYKKGKKERPPFLPALPEEARPMIQHPKEMICQVCGDLLREAVLIPCCGTSFCDECIRNSLLETEEHECPVCHETEISPDRLTANLSMRSLVINYLSKLSQPEKVQIPDNHVPVPNVVPLMQHPLPPQQETEPASDLPPDFIYLPPQVQAAMMREREKKKLQVPPPRTQSLPKHPPPIKVDTSVPPPTAILVNQVPPPQVPPPQQQGPPSQTPAPVIDSQKLPTKEPSKIEDQKPAIVPHVENPEPAAHISVRSGKPHKPMIRPDGFRDIPPGVSPPSRPPPFSGPPGPPPGHMYRPAQRMPGPPPPHFRGPPPRIMGHPPPGGYMPPRDFQPPPPHFVPRPAATFPPPIPFHQPPPIPLSEREFYREKRRLIDHITKKNDPMDDFARTLMERKKQPPEKKKSPVPKRSNSRPRSWSPRSPRARRRSRSKSFSRSPIRSVIKTRSKSRSRTKSKSRSRSRTPKKKIRSRTRTRSRSLSHPRSRSRSHSRYWSRSPARLRSRSRSRSRERFRSRSRSFRPRSLSPRPRSRTRSSSYGPRSRKGPRTRSKSRSYSPKRRLSRSRSLSRSPARRRFSPYRSRSRSISPMPALQPQQGYGRPPDWDMQFRGYRGPPVPGGPRYSPERYPPEYPPQFGVPQAPPPPPPLPPDEYYRMGPRAFQEYLRDYYSRYPHPANPPEYSRLPFPEQRSRSRSPRRPRSWSPSGPVKHRERIDGRNERGTSYRSDKPDSKFDSRHREKRLKENKLPIKKVEKVPKQHGLSKVKTKTKKLDSEKSSKPVKLEKEKKQKKSTKQGLAQKEAKKPDSETNIKSRHKIEKRIKSPQDNVLEEKSDIRAEDKVERINKIQTIEPKPTKRPNKNINASVLVPIREADENESENVMSAETEINEELKDDSMKVKEEEIEETKNKTVVVVGSKKPKNKLVEKVKKTKLKHSKSKKLSGSESHTSDSDIDNKKKRKLKQLIGVSESSVTEDENISPTKRVKVESPVTTITSETEAESEPPPPGTEELSATSAEPVTANQAAKKLSPEKGSKSKDQLMLDPPELSKWERDDAESDHSLEVSTTSNKSSTEKKSLPRSVIESAEKALVMKPLRSSAVSSTVASVKPQRKVYLDEEMTKKVDRPKMVPRQTMMQITFTSAGSNKRKVSESDADQKNTKSEVEQKHIKGEKEQSSKNKEETSGSRGRRSVMERLGKQRSDPNIKTKDDQNRTDRDEKGHYRNDRDRGDKTYSRGDHDKVEGSYYRGDRDRDRDNRNQYKSDYDKSDRSRNRHDPDKEQRNPSRSNFDKDDRIQSRNEYDKYEKSKNRPDSDKYHRSYDNIDESYADSRRSRNKEHSSMQSKSDRTSDKSPDSSSHRVRGTDKPTRDKQSLQMQEKKFDKIDRKESVVDESKFEPDYEDSSGSESPDKTSKAERLTQSSDSETASSDEESPAKKQKAEDENEKRNKKNKHKKHKKHKHKHKKKKHKKHKEEKVKSVIKT